MRDYTLAVAPSRESLGADFWSSARPLYPSRGRRPVRVRLDPEVLAWFQSAEGGGLEEINSVLRAHVEAKLHDRRKATRPG
jgi:uncharacterized protein (DUF4415 family)